MNQINPGNVYYGTFSLLRIWLNSCYFDPVTLATISITSSKHIPNNFKHTYQLVQTLAVMLGDPIDINTKMRIATTLFEVLFHPGTDNHPNKLLHNIPKFEQVCAILNLPEKFHVGLLEFIRITASNEAPEKDKPAIIAVLQKLAEHWKIVYPPNPINRDTITMC